jgi:DNA polymerase I-like protein with 3'-5' exonuclease and polymerase domains
MKIRVTYGLDRVKEGAHYHLDHILNDLKALAAPATPLPMQECPSGTVVGVDTEYDAKGELLTVGLADHVRFDSYEWNEEERQLVRSAFKSGCYNYIIGHNIPGDIDQLAKNGLHVKEDWYTGKKILDSYLLAKMVDENKPKGSYGLEPLMLTSHNVQPWKEETDAKFKETGDAADWTPEEREARCRMDAWASYMLAKKYYRELATDKQKRLLIQTIHRISMTLYRIGLAGALVDRHYLGEFNSTDKRTMAITQDTLRNYANRYGWDKPEPFSPTKDDDIRYLLYDKIKLAPVDYTKGGKPTVDKTSLKQHLDSPKYAELISQLLKYSQVQKLDSVYGDMDQHVDKDGFLHFWIQQLGARTGRRTSGGQEDGPTSKNAQNWPPIAKKMIVSRFKGGKIGAFDYQSLEPVLYAWISQDANLFRYFYEGRGYLDICNQVLKKDIDKSSPIYKAIKSMTLGIFYNMQDKKMAINLWLGVMMDEPFRFSDDFMEHQREVGKHRRKILGLFPGLVRYMESQKVKLARDKQITAPDGYVRHLPHNGESSLKYWSLVNQAINFPVQHLASMVTGCAMIDCEEAILKRHEVSYADWTTRLRNPESKWVMPVLINEVHDELTWDLPNSYDSNLILETMKHPPSLTKLIPGFNIDLKIEANITDRWGDKQ